MSKFVKNAPCLRCRDNGDDKAGDNFALYADGSGYCWKCKHYTLSDNVLSNYKQKHTDTPKVYTMPKILLPKDSVADYPNACVNWMGSYELDKTDMLYNGLLWSEKEQRLIFPLWNGETLEGWQGRYFGTDKTKAKWYSRGDVQNIIHILYMGRVGQHHPDASQLVLTEDIISAIKVSKLGIPAMPLFGVNIKARIPQFRVLKYLEYIIFLDEDMHQHSLKESLTMRLNGFKTKSILSECDPKEYSYTELECLLKE